MQETNALDRPLHGDRGVKDRRHASSWQFEVLPMARPASPSAPRAGAAALLRADALALPAPGFGVLHRLRHGVHTVPDRAARSHLRRHPLAGLDPSRAFR